MARMSLGSVSETLVQRLSKRVPVIRATDVVLAALQSAFSQPTLMGMDNAFRFNRDDPKHSRVWICAPDNRVANERDGARMMITVDRGDYTPNELHLQNFVGGSSSGPQEFKDLATVMIFLRCEAGVRIQSEMMATIAYNVLKLFRKDLMREYDIHNIRLGSISTPMELNDAGGGPWVTTVSVRIELEEYAILTELANSANRVNIVGAIGKNLERIVADSDFFPVPDTETVEMAALDGVEAFPPVDPLPGGEGTPEHP